MSIVSKIIERVVECRLIEHVCFNNLLIPHQSAYTVNNTLFFIHDYVIIILIKIYQPA